MYIPCVVISNSRFRLQAVQSPRPEPNFRRFDLFYAHPAQRMARAGWDLDDGGRVRSDAYALTLLHNTRNNDLQYIVIRLMYEKLPPDGGCVYAAPALILQVILVDVASTMKRTCGESRITHTTWMIRRKGFGFRQHLVALIVCLPKTAPARI